MPDSLMTHTSPAAAADVLTLERMRADLAALLYEDPSAIADDDNLIDLGLDSMRAMSLITRWRTAGADITFAECAERPELGHWWALVQRKRQPAAAASTHAS
jgi:aryl carrier-like protein